MKILLDTNVLLRIDAAGHVQHRAAVEALDRLHVQGHKVVLVPQVVYEYWVVATRPVVSNGLGLSTDQVAEAIDGWTAVFRLYRDERGIYDPWRSVVSTHDVKGKNAHDARLVAAMQRHRLPGLLTFNSRDFARSPQSASSRRKTSFPGAHTCDDAGCSIGIWRCRSLLLPSRNADYIKMCRCVGLGRGVEPPLGSEIMLRIDAGAAGRYCDGMSRRSFVQLGVAGMASVGMPTLLRAKEQSAERKNTSCILIWLDGGPSHLDLYDMKPEAPLEVRGMWNPIPTNVSGFEITELFPKQAQIADKFSMVRSLHHDTGDHFAGGHRMLTTKDMGVSGANNAGRFPGIGSIVARECGSRQIGMPPYVAVPVASSIGLNPGYFGGHMLGLQYDPFQTHGDPNSGNFQIQNLNLAPGLTVDRLEDRRTLLASLDRIPRTAEKRMTFDAMDRFDQAAYEFVSGPAARRAFDINKEDPKIRDMYGRHNWGQSTLLARRLVEAGSTFVTVHYGGWDHHWNLREGMNQLLPIVDSAVSGLFRDLDQRGLLDTTLVVLCGEFSRTPRMNDGGNGGPAGSMGTPGRDHWGNSMFCLMGGGGIQGGRIIGSTDRNGTAPASRPLRPDNIHATIYRVLGVDPKLHILDHAGRPVPVLEDPTAIGELF